MSSWKISFGSEPKQRALSSELIGTNLKCENAPFTFYFDHHTYEEVRKAPLAYVPDLVGKVTQLLDQNDRYLVVCSGQCLWYIQLLTLQFV